jgi:type II secretory pathway pseudopilin PulG
MPFAQPARVKGFTLVEAAIVLVIIGLLVGATITGQKMIAGVQAKRTVAEVRDITAAYLLYYDRYRAIPGDDPRASTRWPGAKDGNGDGRISGSYDAAPPEDAAALVVDSSEGENLNFWWHLRLAGLINGASDSNSPAAPNPHPLGGRSGIQQDAYGMRGGVMCMSNVASGIAGAMDTASDDQLPDRGAMRGASQAGGEPPAAYAPGDEDYLLCVSLGGSSGGRAVAFAGPPADTGGQGGSEPGDGGSDAGAGDPGGDSGDAGDSGGDSGDSGGGGSGGGGSGGGYGGDGWGWGGGHWGGGGGGHGGH